MIWVGSFKSLQSVLGKVNYTDGPLELHTWARSDIDLISPLVEWLIGLIAASRCVCEKEEFVELALREALSNAILHGNRLDTRKLVHIRCCCEGSEGVSIVVRDQGQGFDPTKVPDPLAFENLTSEHGRGLHLMKLAMDEVSFERGGTEVRMRKLSGDEQKTAGQRVRNHIKQRLVRRPCPGVRVVEWHRNPFAPKESRRVYSGP